MATLAAGVQDPVERRFAGQTDALVGQHLHDARRRYAGKARLVDGSQYRLALISREQMGRRRSYGRWPQIAFVQAAVRLPSLQAALAQPTVAHASLRRAPSSRKKPASPPRCEISRPRADA